MRDRVRENARYLLLLALAGSVLLGYRAREGEPAGPPGEAARRLAEVKTRVGELRGEVDGLKVSAAIAAGDHGGFGIGADWRHPAAAVPDAGLRAYALGVALDEVEAAVDAAIAALGEAEAAAASAERFGGWEGDEPRPLDPSFR